MTSPPGPASAPEPIAGNPASDAQMLALLVDSVREYAIYLLSPSGVIRTWNRGGQRIKGYAPHEILGQPYARMFPPEDQLAGKPGRLLERAAAEGSCRDEGWRMRKDGTRFWATVVITALRDPDGTLTGFAKVSRDETERHLLEERIRQHAKDLERAVQERTRELEEQAQRLRQANEELEQFNYIASHDLQEPIRMVSLYMQKLAGDEGRLAPEQRQRYMRYAREGADRMRLLIDDLLRYNRLERDHEPAVADGGAALGAALDTLAPLVEQHHATVERGALPRVRASLGQLPQVFQNLIENALKYRSSQPPRILVAAAPEDGAWRFSVADNGIGIEARYHERIFAVFQRLHSREEYPGTGMGLAICRKIVERHGGRIWVESALGAGATFHFTLPGA